MLALLDPQTPEFAVCPPHFILDDQNRYPAEVERALQTIFGDISSETTRRAAPFLLASLIFHLNWLEEKLPSSHKLFKSPLYTSLSLDERIKLASLVTIENKNKDIEIKGVPVSVKLLQQVKEINVALDDFRTAMQTQQEDLRKIAELIPQSAAGVMLQAGQKQFERFATAIEERIESVLTRTSQPSHLHPIQYGSNAAEQLSQIAPDGYKLFHWAGKFRCIPENFVLDRGEKVALAWAKWWWMGEARMPMRLIYERKLQSDVVDLYRFHPERGMTPRVVSNALTERRQLMEYIIAAGEKTSEGREIHSQLLEARGVEAIQCLQAALWKHAWKVVETELRETEGNSAGGKRRRHDLARCTVRTLLKKVTK